MTRIVLVGRAGAGKSHAAAALSAANYKVALSHTTRAAREGEEHMVDYFFVDRDVFESIEFYERVEHGENGYGMSRQQWQDNDVFIFNPRGIENIRDQNDRDATFVVFINTPEHVRNTRLAERGWSNDQIAARNIVDDEQFTMFTDYDLRIDEPDHDIVDLVKDVVAPSRDGPLPQ